MSRDQLRTLESELDFIDLQLMEVELLNCDLLYMFDFNRTRKADLEKSRKRIKKHLKRLEAS